MYTGSFWQDDFDLIWRWLGWRILIFIGFREQLVIPTKGSSYATSKPLPSKTIMPMTSV
jgi:hypothetical protein